MAKKTAVAKAPEKVEETAVAKAPEKVVFQIAVTGFLFKGRMYKPCKEHNAEINKPAYAEIAKEWLKLGYIK